MNGRILPERAIESNYAISLQTRLGIKVYLELSLIARSRSNLFLFFSVIYWDIEFSLRKYVFELGHPVSTVAMKPEEDFLFASGQINGTAYMWDVREESPASMLIHHPVG